MCAKKKDIEVIIADSEVIVRDKIASVLRNSGFVVTIAERGFQMLSMIEDKKYDIAVLTTELPDMSAFEAVSLIRSKTPSYELPIFLMQTTKDEEWNQKIIGEGVNDFEKKTNDNVPKIAQKIRALVELFSK